MTTTLEYAAIDRVEARGADAVAFLQAQLASDVAGLADGASGWSCWLTPPGRTIAVFRVVRHAGDAVDLEIPAARGEEIAGRLQRFVFRSKVKLAVQRDSPPIGEWPRDEAALRRWAIGQGIPLLAGGAVETQTPHALGLDRFGAISTKKGCYPGQEIVARTHFLGRNKRHLVRWSAPAWFDIEPGAQLRDEAGNPVAMHVLGPTPAEGPMGGLAVATEQALQGVQWVDPAGRPVTFERVHGSSTDAG